MLRTTLLPPVRLKAPFLLSPRKMMRGPTLRSRPMGCVAPSTMTWPFVPKLRKANVSEVLSLSTSMIQMSLSAS